MLYIVLHHYLWCHKYTLAHQMCINAQFNIVSYKCTVCLCLSNIAKNYNYCPVVLGNQCANIYIYIYICGQFSKIYRVGKLLRDTFLVVFFSVNLLTKIPLNSTAKINCHSVLTFIFILPVLLKLPTPLYFIFPIFSRLIFICLSFHSLLPLFNHILFVSPSHNGPHLVTHTQFHKQPNKLTPSFLFFFYTH